MKAVDLLLTVPGTAVVHAGCLPEVVRALAAGARGTEKTKNKTIRVPGT